MDTVMATTREDVESVVSKMNKQNFNVLSREVCQSDSQTDIQRTVKDNQRCSAHNAMQKISSPTF